MLLRKWASIQDAVSYAELSNAIRQGKISKGQVEQWRNEYSLFMAMNYGPYVGQSVANAATAKMARYGGILHDPMYKAIDRYISRRGRFLVKELTTSQRDAMNSIVRMAAFTDNMTIEELAYAVGPCIGLTERQARAAFDFYRQRHADYYNIYIDSGMGVDLSSSKAAEKALTSQAGYKAKLHKERAYNIASNELAYAYNNGIEEVVRECIIEGKLPGGTRRKWFTSRDERVCKKCGSLDGVIVGMNEKFPGDIDMPPAHNRCRCALDYIYD